MINKADFERLTTLAMSDPGRAHMRPVIQKELLHYDILYCLDNAGLLDQLTFQGGTSLRLCHGSPRFSEDLDFVGGKDFSRQQLEPIKECIEHYIGQRYGLLVSVKEPRELKHEREYADLKIDKWQISLVTSQQLKHIPQQRIKVEVANIEAYSREPKALQLNYNFLPEGYGDTLVLTETLDEIMADKLVSLVNTTGYVRNRDIWDLRWLKQQGAELRTDWVTNKIRDYRIDDYPGKLARMIERLPEIIEGEVFQREILRFVPQEVAERTLKKPKFNQFLTTEVSGLLEQVQVSLSAT
ncbi:MAG: nucleotidyl transferase AbiEii/AbiGii toxin family protein [Gammaproteobacteria bacterium]|nr:nucleotidyl transferase AbiEii/AbiGii toxin family protein [Gammaproteobacteria bacterium]MDP2141454.1 nucleotidyl transferase AbiEii/AbiGii toxin family protein [Gammaproteobacteria bacterium]MDP2347521.1 nucleotidyl transferase AbiEii/AbiGii toxin family protein [Gammaproteobacteria bacterium]